MKLFLTSFVISAALIVNACSDSQTSSLTPNSPSTLDSAAELTQGRALPGNVRSAAPNPARAAANFEIKFLTGMIDHHHMAVMMAEVCQQKAVHGDLEALCNDIVTSQSQEIEVMQSWLQSWYAITYEPMIKPGDMKMMDRMEGLNSEEFEIMFMEMMIRHHSSAIREAEKCLDKASHPELHSLCSSIIETQSTEIAQMETWLCQWYGRC